MPRLMSVSLTERSVVERRKTVTRRVGWRFLKPGDRLTLCRKVMGRKKGEPLVRLAEVEVVDIRREPLCRITDADIEREAVEPVQGRFCEVDSDTGQPTVDAWMMWFWEEMGVGPSDEVTRIEWRYLNPPCAFCGDPFTDEQWEARHEPGTLHVHAECCDPCPSESDLSDAAADHVFGQGRGLKRDDGRPKLIGRDVPTNEQLALAEAASRPVETVETEVL